MAFLELKNIGKIYVSEGNVAVGIRGVSLSFEKGEFVAVTGESGSGKSTLLNVISGMDSYEEGEMLIEGRQTSHFLEPEREIYREQYISFIFQDYNILDSFTVLQNVELALMSSVRDPAMRRERAVELLKRVGLGDKLHQRGSKLSGGQKQRTVIARALAKDSPIILADEPTGNLDSESAKEIVALLREVAKDKLLIVVTHSFTEVAGYAAREIRVFDGAVVSDTRLKNTEVLPEAEAASEAAAETQEASGKLPAAPLEKAKKPRTVLNGITLGRAMFGATPKLSLFLCLLMLLASLGLLAVTARCGRVPGLLAVPTMFAPEEGRLVVTRNDGAPLDDREVEALADETAAVRTLHYDYLLDAFQNSFGKNTYLARTGESYALQPVFGKQFPEKLYGREPQADCEALLYLPVSYRRVFGRGGNPDDRIAFCQLEFDVVGVQYYLDNNQTPKILLTEDGFACALAAYLLQDAEQNIRVGYENGTSRSAMTQIGAVMPSFFLPEDKAYVSEAAFTNVLNERTAAGSIPVAEFGFAVNFRSNNSFLAQFMSFRPAFRVSNTVPGDIYLRDKPEGLGDHTLLHSAGRSFIAVNANTLRRLTEASLAEHYTQASLFYGSDRKAQEASAILREKGYTAALSTDKYSPQAYETILNTAQGIFLLLLWILTVLFLAFFIHLCTGKAIGAFRHDLAILRSMGIPVRTVVSGLFTRLYLSLLPAAVCVLALALFLFRTPKGNALFPYLYWWQYLLIFLGMVLMASRVGRRQVKTLFGTSVREALRGGDEG